MVLCKVAELLRSRSEEHVPENPAPRIALLIDADNTSQNVMDLIMEEVSRHGNAITRRAYGDFTTQNLAPWKEPMASHAILAAQSYQNTKEQI